jgi:hypothetical protein
MNESQQNIDQIVEPVKIGEVTVTEPITTKEVLASQGIVEIIHPDGTRQQITKKQAQEELNRLQSIQSQLEGATQ